MKLLIGTASLCLTVGSLAPFAILPLSIELKTAKIEQARLELSVDDNINYETIVNEQAEQGAGAFTPTTNQTLELDGYGSIGYSTKYFELITKESTNTRKHLKYEDLKTRLEIGFITDMSTETDIPGYITQKVAGVNTTTNDKYELVVDDATWVVVPAKDMIDEQIVKVYYLLGVDNNSALWIRANINPDYDAEKFDTIIESMLRSENVYYRGSTVFDTPNSGYYAENKPEGDNKAQGQDDYKQNDDSNKVYQNEAGFVKSDISTDWEDLEIILDKVKIHIPCVVSDLLNNGAKINDTSGNGPDDTLGKASTTSLNFRLGTSDFTVYIKNDDANNRKKIKDCRIYGIEISKEMFSETKDLPDDYVVLPGGMTFNIYTDKIVEYFGTPNSSEDSIGADGTLYRKYTWRDGKKYMTIEAGIVANITYIAMFME